MKKTIIDLFEDSVVKYGAKTFLLEKKHRAFEPTTYAETRSRRSRPARAGCGGHTPRGQSGDTLGGVQCMDHFGTGRLLCRGGQRAAVGETRRVERPAVPYAPCRSQGAVRIEIPALQDPAHTRGAAAGGAYHRHRPHAARSGRDGARDAPAHGPRLPGGK